MKTAPLFILAIAAPLALAQSLESDVASIKPASQEQFMASIRAGQDQIEMLVIDHIEKTPTDN